MSKFTPPVVSGQQALGYRDAMPKDKLIGKIKETAGAVLGNKLLEQEGELQQSKAEAAAEARRLEERASVQATSTDLAARQREIELEQQRLSVEVSASERAARIEAEEAGKLAEVEQRTEAELTAVRYVEARARDEHEQAMASARQAQRAAEQAKQTADVIDGTRNQMEA